MAKTALNQVWKALSDPTRRTILDLLSEKPRTTGELCSKFRKLSRFAVMKHLNLLEQSRLIRVRKEGRFRWNYLDPSPIHQIDQHWMRRFRSAN